MHIPFLENFKYVDDLIKYSMQHIIKLSNWKSTQEENINNMHQISFNTYESMLNNIVYNDNYSQSKIQMHNDSLPSTSSQFHNDNDSGQRS